MFNCSFKVSIAHSNSSYLSIKFSLKASSAMCAINLNTLNCSSKFSQSFTVTKLSNILNIS